mgnify:CR=1 FL=1
MMLKLVLSLLVMSTGFLTNLNLSSSEKQGLPTEAEQKILLEKHNEWRRTVGVPPLEWSEELAKSALKWAKNLKRGCRFEHSDSGYGENLWKGTTGAYALSVVVDSWGNEVEYYNYETNECDPGQICGHYTQVVWGSTKKVGCASIECDGFTTWVCQYDPPGNWIGQKPY